jgi:hypothetical protein
MEKEYYEIKYSDPFFKGYFTKEKFLELIELKEKEGWEFKGDKNYLRRISFRSNLSGWRHLKEKVLAILERERDLKED